MIRISKVLLGLALLAPFSAADEDVALAWGTDVEEALASAGQDNKLVLVEFYAPLAVWSEKLEDEIFTVMAVQDRLRQFILVRVNTDVQRDIAVRYEVEGLPTIVCLTPDGEVLDRIAGFFPAPDLCERLDRVLSGDVQPQERPPVEMTPRTENPLPPLADMMDQVRGFLERERVDRVVQLKQDEILEEIERLIEEVKEAQKSSSQQRRRRRNQRNQQRPQDGDQQQQQQQQSRNPAQDEVPESAQSAGGTNWSRM